MEFVVRMMHFYSVIYIEEHRNEPKPFPATFKEESYRIFDGYVF